MFVVYSSNPKKISLIRRLLAANGLVVRETKLPEYLYVESDPSPHIPARLKSGVRIERVKRGYTRFLKNAGRISELLRKAGPEPPAPGDCVRILAGRFEGFSGIVKTVTGEKECLVEVSVWGNILTTTCAFSEIKKVETEF